MHAKLWGFLFWIIGLFLAVGLLAQRASAAGPLPLYTDALTSGWEDWSWGDQTHSFTQPTPTHSGNAALQILFTGGWSGVQIGTGLDTYSTGQTNTVEMWLHGGSSGGQQVLIAAGNDCSSVTQTVTLTANTWTRVQLSLAGLGQPAPIKWVYWFNPGSQAQPVFYVDDVYLTETTPVVTTGSGPQLSVNAAGNAHAISPYIYGMNFPDADLAAEIHLPVQRWGGNSTTRYNWQINVSNHASDWYFENLPADLSADQFIADGAAYGAQTLLTVPLIGWTPKSSARTCGFSVQKYGAQQSTDPWSPDCGNGVLANGSLITGNDPLDTSTAITPAFVQNWISHLQSTFEGGVHFYDLDNEPMLWNSTHRDVYPTSLSYDELLTRTITYAAAIKAADPQAQTFGPVLWGWTAYFYSARDSAAGGNWWENPQDRLAHGDTPLTAWYLQQLQAYQNTHGVRLLDYLDLHYYPQAKGVFSTAAGDEDTQTLRLRSTRALWDPAYSDESWIGEPVYLIPRMRAWVNENYPGTKLAISEYNWGALCHISGALAQADVLGIFGREDLDLATLWDAPASGQPGAFAFRLFRNADGHGAGFGQISLPAASADSDRLSVFAARRNDGALTIIVINKTSIALTADLALSGFTAAGSSQLYQYSAAHQDQILSLAGPDISPSGFSLQYPPNSISLLVLPDAHRWGQIYLPAVMR